MYYEIILSTTGWYLLNLSALTVPQVAVNQDLKKKTNRRLLRDIASNVSSYQRIMSYLKNI